MKPTANEIEIAKRIVKILMENDFSDALIDEDDWVGWCDNHALFLEENHLKGFCGVSKACIFSEELPNWVVKTGFIWNDDDDDGDFCTIEAHNYQDAIAEGIEEFFAASYELCTVTTSEYENLRQNIYFYIQEKAEPDEERTSSTCDRYIRSEQDIIESEDEPFYYDYTDEDRLESLFGECKNFDRLIKFVREWQINDLHTGNFGYTKEGIAKIIDYSGI